MCSARREINNQPVETTRSARSLAFRFYKALPRSARSLAIRFYKALPRSAHSLAIRFYKALLSSCINHNKLKLLPWLSLGDHIGVVGTVGM